MYKRLWLNRQRGRAFVEVDVQNEVVGKRYMDASVTIADCDRRISLDFAATKVTRGEKLQKVRRLIAALQDVEQALVDYKFGKGRNIDD